MTNNAGRKFTAVLTLIIFAGIAWPGRSGEARSNQAAVEKRVRPVATSQAGASATPGSAAP